MGSFRWVWLYYNTGKLKKDVFGSIRDVFIFSFKTVPFIRFLQEFCTFYRHHIVEVQYAESGQSFY
jgi:hypothetical protein